ncbi:MAG: tRNA (adenosine(37)-N6)-threonylcarbamoyltransferase complex transferase subunit TsaD [Candidatus Shapirobacteria bacterium]
MRILALETSADDTCASVVDGQRVLSNVVSSQTEIHKEWGGIVPNLAKRAHMERIGPVVEMALKRAKTSMEEIETVAVSLGPGLGIALSAGVNKAKEIAKIYNKKIIGVNHVEGHLWSLALQNKAGNPARAFEFPLLVLTASGGHTKIVLIKPTPNPSLEKGGGEKRFVYEIIGETLDDAAGEALDKAAKMLGLGYPGGPVIERLALEGDEKYLALPQPLNINKVLNFSFSGLKTSFYYKVRGMDKNEVDLHLRDLAASYQKAVFDHLERKFKLAIIKYEPKMVGATGGVLANQTLRNRLRKMARTSGRQILFPAKKIYNTDNAAMIGLVGGWKASRGEYDEIESLDIKPNWEV